MIRPARNASPYGICALGRSAFVSPPAAEPLIRAVSDAGFQALLVPDATHVPGLRDQARAAGIDILADAADPDAARRAQAAGADGVRGTAMSAEGWADAVADLARDGAFAVHAWTPGAPREALARLAPVGYASAFASTAWWNGRESWLAEEYEALRRIAPVRCTLRSDGPDWLAALAAAAGDGIFLEIADIAELDGPRIAAANRLAGTVARLECRGEVRFLPPARGRPALLLRADASDIRHATRALVIAIGVTSGPVEIPEMLPAAAGRAFAPLRPLASADTMELGTGQVRLLMAEAATPVRARTAPSRQAARKSAGQPRIAIEKLTPSVDAGRFPAKAVAGDRIRVEADIFADGHEKLAAAVLWRPADREDWSSRPMQPVGNDRWAAEIAVDRPGRWLFTVEAWWDEFGSYHHELDAKLKAGRDVTLEIAEGRILVEEAAERAEGEAGRVLAGAIERLERDPGDAAVLLDTATRDAVRSADARGFLVRHEPPLPLAVERPQAAFASWYELFPRSITDDAQRHGTLADVVGRLPAIRRMGFDVLYFPPIHPIGQANRKGRNNSLTPQPADVGSPYAIGSAEGGHDAIHPQLGTIEDFRRLVAAAADEGLEIALDFAIQCSPDHPWLKAHPGWFRWRPDGSLRYAENPPKKYEDIVNVDFYASAAVPELWLALRDIVLFWAAEGVRTYRVDNPHTKPLPFWEWLIADVQARYPDTLFLSEAFTRPKMMNRLAKLGFSQSYTYFTWRNTKAELTAYMTELAHGEPKDFFRPHFFVNTPDINPVFLQTSGRPGFLIRAALAATLSGLWGVYSGFEHCEGTPLPGREEYLDSEKYEIRPRPERSPGDIVDEITRLNAIRRAHPALQDHRKLRFYNAFDERVLVYGRQDGPGAEMVLVIVSLDPHAVVEAEFELPLWEWGLPDHGSLAAVDLMRERPFLLTGKRQRLRLDPADLPFAILRLAPPEASTR
ncbi:hypothetical protein STAQ_16050 [Allostella sp. ATCC 35155]|nr:hypothetical protein STAQ_16050 [Stella sp. ATCC 35155]